MTAIKNAVSTMLTDSISASSLDWSDFEIIHVEWDSNSPTVSGDHYLAILYADGPDRGHNGEINGSQEVMLWAPRDDTLSSDAGLIDRLNVQKWDSYCDDLCKQLRALPARAGYFVNYNVNYSTPTFTGEESEEMDDDSEDDGHSFLYSTINIEWSIS